MESKSVRDRTRGVGRRSWLMIGEDEFGVMGVGLSKRQDPSGNVWEVVGHGVWSLIRG